MMNNSLSIKLSQQQIITESIDSFKTGTGHTDIQLRKEHTQLHRCSLHTLLFLVHCCRSLARLCTLTLQHCDDEKI